MGNCLKCKNYNSCNFREKIRKECLKSNNCDDFLERKITLKNRIKLVKKLL